MSPRKFDVSDFGFTEEQWRRLDEQRKRYFVRRAYYHRNIERARAYQREYERRRRERNRAGDSTESGASGS